MSNITFGSEAPFNEASTTYISSAKLDSTHVVVAYRGADTYGYAVVGLVNTTTLAITWGTPVEFNAANTSYISVAALDSTHFVVAYRDLGSSNYGIARVGVVSGTTISSYGAENVFSTYTNNIKVAALDSTHFVVVYQDGDNSEYGTAKIGLVSGTTISSYGSANVFNEAESVAKSVATLDSTHFVVSYIDYGNEDKSTFIIGLVSGTTISSYGAESVFSPYQHASDLSVSTIDATHFVVAYRDEGNSSYGTVAIGTTSGTTISSYGAENVFNETTTVYVSISVLDSTHFVVAYKDDGGDDYGGVKVGTVSGTTISGYTAEALFNSAVTNYISVAAIDSDNFIVSYQDDGGDDYGIARVGTTIAIISPFPTFFRT